MNAVRILTDVTITVTMLLVLTHVAVRMVIKLMQMDLPAMVVLINSIVL